MKRVLVLLAACARPPDKPACAVELAGNLAETSASPALCPHLVAGAGATQGDTLLRWTVPSRALGGSFTIEIDVGREPSPGVYSAGSTTLWNAAGTRPVPPGGACMFLAGNNATPTGNFVLDLTSLEPHGTLALTLYVLPRTTDSGVQTDCGRGTTEELHLRF